MVILNKMIDRLEAYGNVNLPNAVSLPNFAEFDDVAADSSTNEDAPADKAQDAAAEGITAAPEPCDAATNETKEETET